MTYIEFFSPVVSENVCACLARMPERVVLVGDNRKLLKRHADRYTELFREKNPEHSVEIIGKSVNKNNMQSVINALSSTATGKTIIFQKAAKEAAFTQEEWDALIAAKPNWTISLV